MARKIIEKGAMENPKQQKDIPPSAGLLNKLAVESAEYLISQPENKVTHGNIVKAIQNTLRENGIEEPKWQKYYDLIRRPVSDLARHPEKLKAAKSRPQHQSDLLPEIEQGEELKFEPTPEGELKIYYQGHEYFAKLSAYKDKKVVVIRRGENSISLTDKQYNFFRNKAHAIFAEIEKKRREKNDPRQKSFL